MEMPMESMNRLSRRQLMQLGAGSLLAAGMWPGWAWADDAKDTAEFSFLCVNDLHFLDKNCVPFFERVVKQMKATEGKPDFCLIVGDLSEDGAAAQIGSVKDIFKGLEMPIQVVVGNHDHDKQNQRKAY